MNEKIDQAVKLLEELIQEDTENNAITLVITQNLPDANVDLRVVCQGKSEILRMGLLGAVTQGDELTYIFADVVTDVIESYEKSNSQKINKPIYLN